MSSTKWQYATRPTEPGLYLRTTKRGYNSVLITEENGELFYGTQKTPLSEIPVHVSWLGPLTQPAPEAWDCFAEEPEGELPEGRANQRLALIAGAVLDFAHFLESRGLSVMGLLAEFCANRGLELATAQPKWWTFAQVRYQLRMRAQGRCLICGEPAVNKRHCEAHREDRRVKQNEKRAALREKGIRQKRYG